MCMHIYIYVYSCMCICIYIYMYTYVCIYIYAYIYIIYIFTYIHIFVIFIQWRIAFVLSIRRIQFVLFRWIVDPCAGLLYDETSLSSWYLYRDVLHSWHAYYAWSWCCLDDLLAHMRMCFTTQHLWVRDIYIATYCIRDMHNTHWIGAVIFELRSWYWHCGVLNLWFLYYAWSWCCLDDLLTHVQVCFTTQHYWVRDIDIVVYWICDFCITHWVGAVWITCWPMCRSALWHKITEFVIFT